MTRDVINNLICELVANRGITALTIAHGMTSARKIEHEVAMLYEGRIIWRGSRGGLYASGYPFLEQFVQGHAHGLIR